MSSAHAEEGDVRDPDIVSIGVREPPHRATVTGAEELVDIIRVSFQRTPLVPVAAE
jgi:hypothetical protein